VNELWSWNIYSYTWKYEKVVSADSPSQREMHSAGVVDGNIFIFGGRSRNAAPATGNTVYSDFWRLNVEPFLEFNQTFRPATPQPIAEGVRSPFPLHLIPGAVDPYHQVGGENEGVSSARFGPCMRDLMIEVELTHSCVNQLRLSLLGPGPSTGSPNFHPHSSEYEVLLFDSTHWINTTACARGSFDFLFSETGSLSTTTCCQTPEQRYSFKPDGRLYEYLGGTPFANWTLVIEDMSIDGQVGELVSWTLTYLTEPCNRQYSWTQLQPTNPSQDLPPARYSSNMIVYQDSVFLFGGRGQGDDILTDLYRYDLQTNTWASLFPVHFNIPFGTASMVGMNLALSRWGLIRFGGYIRLPSFANGQTYVNDVFLMDPVTLQWKVVEVETSSQFPSGRYLSGSVFLPSHSFNWRTQFSYRALFDQRLTSTGANFGASLMDSLLVFGGDNGAAGSFVDGSSGGMLNDMWQLRFGNWSLGSNRKRQDEYVERQCQWRRTISGRESSARQNLCAAPNVGSVCDLRDLIMLAWCNNQNQTVT
jgi:subtilisin-like proprotein convertase family protein